ncbi:MAG: radical SAM protein [Rhodospirillaceae bacterium]|jgi:DNA repair photolyase|nr:radical SAM protein [Rhodospirillaceae bacterium]|tara:strand:- start:7417 stop:8505 length:1089 start_codon:yes stop_codon:yes gene_type:complete
MDYPQLAWPIKGRGAVTNRSGRFEPESRETLDDGWELDDADLPPLRTTVTFERPKTIIARNTSPDIPYDRSINPYRGCEHGCVYCYARPSHAYLGLSPGLDFESRLLAKPEAAKLLEQELSKPGYKPQVINIGANTDPYQPVERRHKITRQVLEVLSRFNHPVTVITKSDLICRDIDILAPMAEKGLAAVGVSVTTLDPKLARALEPRAPRADKRLAAIRTLSNAGVPVTVMAAPMIPVLNDAELERVLEAAAEAGATGAGYILLRLPLELKDLFMEWLRTHVPDMADHVLSQVRETRGGGLYDSEFKTRMKGTGQRAGLLARRFDLACKRLNLNNERHPALGIDTSQFRVPPQPGDQLRLL